MKRAFLFTVFIALVSTASAQEKRLLNVPGARHLDKLSEQNGPTFRHLTAELLASEKGRAALAEYGRLKRDGLLPFAQKGASVDIGEVKEFSVAILDSPSGAWESVQFTKMAEEPLFNLWVETAELANGHVTNADVEQMRVAFTAQTPPTSFDPQKGVIENNFNIFGPPPDVDGDGILDVLVVDVRDGWDPGVGGTIILGYFDPINLTGQNNADIIHIDSFPGITDNLNNKFRFGLPEQIFTHELQHLIYDTENFGSDIAFTNEALSTFAELANGYAPPITGTPDYLGFDDEWGRALLSWRQSGGPAREDYQRGGMFMSYLSDRIGVLETGAISRTAQFAADAIQVVVTNAGLLLEDVLAEFHVANFVNDTSLGDAYGHTSPMYQNFRVLNIPSVDGTSTNSTAKFTRGIGQGGAYYYSWENVGDFTLKLTEENGRPALLKPMAVLEKEIGPKEIVELELGPEDIHISGNYTRITLIVPHVDILDWNPNAIPVDPTPPRALIGVESSWEDFESSNEITSIAYDTGDVAQMTIGGGQVNVLSLTAEAMKASRFDVPPGGILTKVLIDQPYETDFGGGAVPPNSPRDYELVVWDESVAGLPGNELFSIPVIDSSPSGIVSFEFQTIDLSAYSDVLSKQLLSQLPAVVFIGVRNTGTDENYFHMTLSDYATGDSPSFISQDALGGWAPFSELCVSSCPEVDLNLFVLPIRAVFVNDSGVTSIDDFLSEIPSSITLEQNYPNPFNPITSIRFTLPNAVNVDLRVFDLLGREVDVLVSELLPSGDHEVQFDAASLASGIYIYKLESGSESLTRTMTLLK